jgi:hypothetical protein
MNGLFWHPNPDSSPLARNLVKTVAVLAHRLRAGYVPAYKLVIQPDCGVVMRKTAKRRAKA